MLSTQQPNVQPVIQFRRRINSSFLTRFKFSCSINFMNATCDDVSAGPSFGFDILKFPLGFDMTIPSLQYGINWQRMSMCVWSRIDIGKLFEQSLFESWSQLLTWTTFIDRKKTPAEFLYSHNLGYAHNLDEQRQNYATNSALSSSGAEWNYTASKLLIERQFQTMKLISTFVVIYILYVFEQYRWVIETRSPMLTFFVRHAAIGFPAT